MSEITRELKVGEKVWYVHNGLAILCEITVIDGYFKRIHPDSYLFYDIDEPVGHSLAADAFVDTREEATEILQDYVDELIEFYEETKKDKKDLEITIKNSNLYDQRARTIAFIVKCHQLGSEESKEAIEELHSKYREKKHLEEWFNYSDIP